jgi:dTDP-4-dehydrorhamnose reductase
LASPKLSSKPGTAEGPILVVGKSGQLARSLMDLAAPYNTPMISIGRPELDLADPASIEHAVATLEPSAMINAAAYTAVDRAEAEAASAYAINRDGAARLAAVARRCGIPFVHVSTDYVFNGEKPSPYVESDVTAPLNVYGQSKLDGETAVLDACPSAVVVRTSWVYSPYGQNFVRTMLRLAATQQDVRVVADQRGTPTSAPDLAVAIVEIVRQRDQARSHSGIYHLAGQGETTWHGFASEIFAALSQHALPTPRLHAISTQVYPTPARRPLNSCLDSSKAHAAFGVQLPPWQTSLDRCLDRLIGQMELTTC